MINILGKLVKGALSYAPRKIIIDGKTIFNPEEELLNEQGCNGPVTEAINKIEKHLNKQAHDMEE